MIIELQGRAGMASDNDDSRPQICRKLHPTERQRQVLVLIAALMTTAEIARTLDLSANTVKDHILAMMATAGVDTRRAVVDIAKSQGLLDMSASPPRWIGCGCPIDRSRRQPSPTTP